MVSRNFRSIYTATKKPCYAVTVTRTSVSLLDELQAQDLEPDLIFWTSLGDAYSSLIFWEGFWHVLTCFCLFLFFCFSLSLSSKIIQGDLYFVWDNLCLFGHPSSLCLAQREGLLTLPAWFFWLEVSLGSGSTLYGHFFRRIPGSPMKIPGSPLKLSQQQT